MNETLDGVIDRDPLAYVTSGSWVKALTISEPVAIASTATDPDHDRV
jgi:hypothetical protein